MKKIFKEYKSWALVTGAASGMGREYARRLALMGYNLVLVDINAKGLGETEDIVKACEGIKVLPVVQDLSQKDAADRVFEQTEAAADRMVSGCFFFCIPGSTGCGQWCHRTIFLILSS